MRLRAAWVVLAAAGQDWPQFLGPARNGVYPGGPVAPGPVIWTREVGQGFAGPVVARGRLALFHRVGDREVVECLDAGTARRIWPYGYPTGYCDDFGFDEGPRRKTPCGRGSRCSRASGRW